MKKNFNLKLTAFLVSLFIALILIIAGNKNKYCLSFGFMLLSLSIVLYIMYKTEMLDKAIIEVSNEMDETEPEKIFELQQLIKEKKKLTSQRNRLNVVFYSSAALLFVIAIAFMF